MADMIKKLRRLRIEFWRLAYIHIELPIHRRHRDNWLAQWFLIALRAQARYFLAIMKDR